jgi:flagellar biosynthetic protein FliR
MIFIGGLLVSLPVLAATLVINAGLGVISRAAPSLNIFAIGFPAMLAIGLVTCLLSMESVSLRIQWLWVRGFASLGELMGGT